MLTKDSAICIRATDFSETSQIVTLFTQNNGKISAIAKGSKRAKSSFDGTIEVFSVGQIVFSHRENQKLATLTEFEQRSQGGSLASNLSALNCGFFAAELINQLTDEYDPHPELFDRLVKFLEDIQQTEDKGQILGFMILFELGLLREVGLQPILHRCANCKGKFDKGLGEIYFSSSVNGLICRDCEGAFQDKIMVSEAVTKCLTNLKSIADAEVKTLKELEKILIYHFTELLGKPPKMAKYVIE